MTSKQTQVEPLLDPKNARVNLYPIQHPKIWEFYNIHRASHWVPEKITLQEDLIDWNKLTEEERKYIKYVLAFFASSDIIVNQNQAKDDEEVQVLEYLFFNHLKEMMEDIHSVTYADLINTYVTDEKEKDILFKAVLTVPVIKKKADWAKQYIAEGDFVHRLVAFSIVEGIFFSGSFCAIFYLRKRGLMPGLCQSNDYISRDEGLHMDFAAMIYRDYIVGKLPTDEIKTIIQSAVKLEKEFCTEALSVELIGMNAKQMCQYIEYVADHLCFKLIGEKLYHSENPFDWMVLIGMTLKDDFFSRRPTSYAEQSLLVPKHENEIGFDAEF